MPPFSNISTIFLDEMIAFLLPLFLVAAGRHKETAREAVRGLLASCNAATEEELRLAAEITSLSFGALDALAKSMAPDMELNTILRLRGCATALESSKNQCQRVLDRLRKDRLAPATEAQVPLPEAKPPAQQPAMAKSVTAKPAVPTKPEPGQPQPALHRSRQQRRAAERAAEKARCGQAEQVRREAMRQLRAIAPQPGTGTGFALPSMGVSALVTGGPTLQFPGLAQLPARK